MVPLSNAGHSFGGVGPSVAPLPRDEVPEYLRSRLPACPPARLPAYTGLGDGVALER
jgi:hypothetical protein